MYIKFWLDCLCCSFIIIFCLILGVDIWRWDLGEQQAKVRFGIAKLWLHTLRIPTFDFNFENVMLDSSLVPNRVLVCLIWSEIKPSYIHTIWASYVLLVICMLVICI